MNIIVFAAAIALVFSYCTEYPCFPTRKVLPLDGLWSFGFQKRGVDPTKLDPSTVQFNTTMYVPGVWDTLTPYAGLRGAGIYKRTFHQTPNTYGSIKFEGCSMWCRIIIDGAEVGTHANGYTAFHVNVPVSTKSVREIVVITDNQFVSSRYPIGYYDMDFYQFGGIPRTVVMYEVSAISFINTDIITTDHTQGVVDLRVRVRVSDNSEPIDIMYFKVSFDDGTPFNVSATKVNDIYSVKNLKVPNPTLWSPSNPNLHIITLQLDSGTPGSDTYEERFGLRKVSSCGNSICINDSPIKLKGYNRHDLEANYGPLMPKIQMYQDIMLLKNANGNFFRLVHYPHDPRFLSMCDEMGILLWQESYGWGNAEAQVTKPEFQSAQLLGLEEMVNNTYNHPSIILWAYLNEGCSHSQKCCDQMYTPLASRYKELGVQGLVTYASDKLSNDVCLHTVDVISSNSYPGWFSGGDDLDANIASILPYVRNEATISKTKYPNKPFIKSEIGAESVWGWEDTFNGVWTQKFQGRYVEQILEAVVGNDTYAGIALWQFFDTRTYNGHSALQRPRAINNMGSLDEYRRPKPVYYMVKERYSKW